MSPEEKKTTGASKISEALNALCLQSPEKFRAETWTQKGFFSENMLFAISGQNAAAANLMRMLNIPFIH